MARSVRKKPANPAKNGNNTSNPSEQLPQIQQFQDLIDLQKAQFENIKSSYIQQNSQLAKSNSSLMMKIADMEKKVSELVQENVVLRSKLSMSELKYKEKLNSQFQILEKGVYQRFEEVVHIFTTVKKKEGLSYQNDANNCFSLDGPRSILKRPSSVNESRRSSKPSITFNENENQIIPSETEENLRDRNNSIELNDEEILPLKKRRKSSRRESLFIPSDFDFSNEYLENELKDIESNSAENAHESNEILPEEQQDQEDESCNFTSSIIEYSIPEEIPDLKSKKNESLPSLSNNSSSSSSRIEIYKDLNDHLRCQSPEHASSKAQTPQSPFVQVQNLSQNKIKHSMKPRVKKKKIIDEIMPTTSTQDYIESRMRRTRGKAVDYTLPSLRAKMRRPTEKLVDATTVTNIHDLQVTANRRRSRSKSKSGSPETLDEDCTSLNSIQIQNSVEPEKEEYILLKPGTSSPSNAKSFSPSKVNVLKEKALNTPPLKTSTKEVPLKDITNKSFTKSSKTRKLSKKAIIGDLGDENSYLFEDNVSNNSSFRLNEEDLSVFDLIGDVKVSSAPKTHRAKAKQLEAIGKRNKKTTFRV